MHVSNNKSIKFLASTVNGNSALALFILLIFTLLVVELPGFLLDILLVLNIIWGLTLLMKGIFIDKALRLYTFPSILVLATLFRLSLNVSSTKLILLHGDQGLNAAGDVIRSFGSFVAGGDPIVGGIIFSIIAIVNFVVIAKGAARIAEVAARFTLDALPGKQLSIDSELRAGSITLDEATARRAELTQSSQFFGSMDGAMKWVQGDAIAGLAITGINFIGGISLGMYRGLDITEALNTFGVLTIGDGLVSILPSLFISIAAGLVIAHISGEDEQSTGTDVFAQLFADPRAVVIASSSLMFLGVLGALKVVSLPFIPFFGVGATILALVYFFNSYEGLDSSHSSTRDQQYEVAPHLGGLPFEISGSLAITSNRSENSVTQVQPLSLRVDPIIIGSYLELSEYQIGTDEGRLDELYSYADQVRETLYLEQGVVLPSMIVEEDPKLEPGSYEIVVREQVVRQGSLQPSHYFVGTNESIATVFGVTAYRQVLHPLTRRDSLWIPTRQAGLDSLYHLGIEIYSAKQFLALETIGSAWHVISELFGLHEVKQVIQSLRNDKESLINELLPPHANVISYPELSDILKRLVRENVTIRDMKLILEGIAEFFAAKPEYEDRSQCLMELHAFLRLILSRGIINRAKGPSGKLRIFALDQEIEEEFRLATSMWDDARAHAPIDPLFQRKLIESASQLFSPVLERGILPIVVLCATDIRVAVQDFFFRNLGQEGAVMILGYQELEGGMRPEPVGVLRC